MFPVMIKRREYRVKQSCKSSKESKVRVWVVVLDGLQTAHPQNEYGASVHVAATPEFSNGRHRVKVEPQPKIWGSVIDAGTAGMGKKDGGERFLRFCP
jgi:hypothetical protein